MRGSLGTFLSAFALTSMAVPADASSLQKNATLTQGPPIQEVMSRYDEALQCVAGQLTPEQKSITFSAGNFSDKTGKTNYVADSGTGNFNTLGEEEMITTSLHKTGVMVADNSFAFKQDVEWMFNKIMLAHQAAMADYQAKLEYAKANNLPLPKVPPNANVSILFPDVIIKGAVTSFDVLPGGGFGVSGAGISIGHRKYQILVAMDASAVLMPGAKLPGSGAQVIGVDESEKQIVGFQTDAGGSGFLGPKDSKNYFSIDFGRKRNEAIQFAERLMVKRLVFKIVTKVLKISACDPQLQYADTIANEQDAKKR